MAVAVPDGIPAMAQPGHADAISLLPTAHEQNEEAARWGTDADRRARVWLHARADRRGRGPAVRRIRLSSGLAPPCGVRAPGATGRLSLPRLDGHLRKVGPTSTGKGRWRSGSGGGSPPSTR